LPPHGEGVAGDPAVQRSLEAAWPADLPARDEQQLRAAGRALLRADATGVGRAEWPEVWPDSGQVIVPAFATARFRIQAAIARRDGSPDKAVVHLVWATCASPIGSSPALSRREQRRGLRIAVPDQPG
jgi:hypothetical protein